MPGVVLMRDRRPEQRHEPIAEELVDRALIPVHLGQRDLEEAVDHQVELLRPQLRRQRAGADYVAEQDAHLLALTLDGAPHSRDLLTDMRRGITNRARRRANRAPTFRAEPAAWRLHRAAAGARNSQLHTTMQAEARLVRILLAASRAPHRRPPPAGQLRRHAGSVQNIPRRRTPASNGRRGRHWSGSTTALAPLVGLPPDVDPVAGPTARRTT